MRQYKYTITMNKLLKPLLSIGFVVKRFFTHKNKSRKILESQESNTQQQLESQLLLSKSDELNALNDEIAETSSQTLHFLCFGFWRDI